MNDQLRQPPYHLKILWWALLWPQPQIFKCTFRVTQTFSSIAQHQNILHRGATTFSLCFVDIPIFLPMPLSQLLYCLRESYPSNNRCFNRRSPHLCTDIYNVIIYWQVRLSGSYCSFESSRVEAVTYEATFWLIVDLLKQFDLIDMYVFFFLVLWLFMFFWGGLSVVLFQGLYFTCPCSHVLDSEVQEIKRGMKF